MDVGSLALEAAWMTVTFRGESHAGGSESATRRGVVRRESRRCGDGADRDKGGGGDGEGRTRTSPLPPLSRCQDPSGMEVRRRHPRRGFFRGRHVILRPRLVHLNWQIIRVCARCCAGAVYGPIDSAAAVATGGQARPKPRALATNLPRWVGLGRRRPHPGNEQE